MGRSWRVIVVVPYVVVQELDILKSKTPTATSSGSLVIAAARHALSWISAVYENRAVNGNTAAAAADSDAHLPAQPFPYIIKCPRNGEVGYSFIVQSPKQRCTPYLPFNIMNRDDEIVDCCYYYARYYELAHACEPDTHRTPPTIVVLTEDRTLRLKVTIQDEGFLCFDNAAALLNVFTATST